MNERTVIKQWMEGDLQFTTFTEPDYDADLSYLEQDYSSDTSITAEEAAEYRRQDQERLDAYHRDEWYMLMVGCEIQAKTATNWAIPLMVGRAYLHSIESDSGSYIDEVANDMVEEARHDMAALKSVLCAK